MIRSADCRDLAIFTIAQDEPELIHPWVVHYKNHVSDAPPRQVQCWRPRGPYGRRVDLGPPLVAPLGTVLQDTARTGPFAMGRRLSHNRGNGKRNCDCGALGFTDSRSSAQG